MKAPSGDPWTDPCPTCGATQRLRWRDDRLAVILKAMRDGIALALREGRIVDNDLRYGLIWRAISDNDWWTPR